LRNVLLALARVVGDEKTDFYSGSKFSNDLGETWRVEDVIKFAKSRPKYLHKDFSINSIKHDLSWWQGDKSRMEKADTSFPVLVLKEKDGTLTIADGLNRTYKALNVEKKKTIPAYLIPVEDIEHLKLP